MTANEIKIVSGAQTGVDQGALHVAIDLGLDWGGWVPKGWRTENGTVGVLFRPKMKEHASSNYLGRTRRNVVDSHVLTGGALWRVRGKARPAAFRNERGNSSPKSFVLFSLFKQHTTETE